MVLFLCWFSLSLADINVELTASRDELSQGEQFQLNLTVTSSGGRLGDFTPQIQGIENFQVLGQSSSTNLSIINGKQSLSKSLIYLVAAPNSGEFKLGPATIAISGETHQSNILNIKVQKGTAGSPSASSGSSAQGSSKTNDDIYLQMEPEKREAFINEPIKVKYKLFTRVPVENYTIESLPKATNFWVEEITPDQKIKQYYQVIHNKKYLVAEIRDVIIYPTASGRQTISTFQISCNVRVRSRDPFYDDFFGSSFFGSSQKVDLTSGPLTISVKALPEEDRPVFFSDGNVGTNFQIQATVDKRDIPSNEAITFRLTITGEANMKMVKDPEIKFPESFNTYQSNTSSTGGGGQLSAKKVLEYAVIPTRKGDFEIPAISFAYFDWKNKRYRVISTQPIPIHVTQGKSVAGAINYSSFTPNEVNLLKEDIRYIKTGLSIRDQKQSIPWWFWLYLVAGLSILPLAYIHSRHQRKLLSDRGYARSFSAAREAKRRLSRAQSLRSGESIDDYYAELYGSITRFIADKTGSESSDLDMVMIRQILTDRKAGTELIDAVLSFLDHCQMIRFSPEKPGSDAKRIDFDTAATLLTRLLKLL